MKLTPPVEDKLAIENEKGCSESPQSLKLWSRMVVCTTFIENEIRARLRQKFGLTLPRFDLMAQLEPYPKGLRMGELSKRMMVTGGNITGITDKLEEAQLVTRVSDADDRRVYSVALTPCGRRFYAKIAAEYEAWIDELLSGIPDQEKNKLISLFPDITKYLAKTAQEK